jgi:2-polyprenyl-3-methyl-5-hydroxy-6-metoxy-1,4-benzoquinol methylase
VPAAARVLRATDTEREFLLDKVSPGERVLDMGCGTGRFTVPMAAAGAQVTGFDLSEGMLSEARRKLDERDLSAELRQGDMANLPFDDGTFDTVTSMLALMHVPLADRPAVFREVSRVLRPGGRMLLCVKNSVFERFFTGDRFASVDITDVEDKTLVFTETHDGTDYTAPWYSFSPDELTGLFARAGMTMSLLRGNSPISVWLADEVAPPIPLPDQEARRYAAGGVVGGVAARFATRSRTNHATSAAVGERRCQAL